MGWLEAGTVVGIIVLAVLVWMFLRMRAGDHIEEMMKKRRAEACRLTSRADFLEGMQKIPVALCLSDDTLYYENPDMQATVELRHIDEIEYDDETATGRAVAGKALRLRSHGHTFEFLLDQATAKQWEAALPPKHFAAIPARAV